MTVWSIVGEGDRGAGGQKGGPEPGHLGSRGHGKMRCFLL